ncbi:PP0621 family protein [Caenimonas koreensis]|uniref:PP0621 family protein n=1 Tax=Caenimonas koreensis TaxID=367474 RepID=UPI003783DBB4
MKFVILIAVVLAVVWLLRGKRGSQRDAPPAQPQAKVAPPEDMVSCPVCSVHLPRTDALPGPGGLMYCCAEHRQRGGS